MVIAGRVPGWALYMAGYGHVEYGVGHPDGDGYGHMFGCAPGRADGYGGGDSYGGGYLDGSGSGQGDSFRSGYGAGRDDGAGYGAVGYGYGDGPERDEEYEEYGPEEYGAGESGAGYVEDLVAPPFSVEEA